MKIAILRTLINEITEEIRNYYSIIKVKVLQKLP